MAYIIWHVSKQKAITPFFNHGATFELFSNKSKIIESFWWNRQPETEAKNGDLLAASQC
jgi:hypothetical protein